MVKLIWDNKKSCKPEDYNLNYFKKFEEYSINVKYQVEDFQSSSNWSNMLFWGDNIEVLYYLLKNFKKKINLIYIDPPFFSGVNYKIKIEEKDKIYDSVAYHDHWNRDLDSYLQMLYERIKIIKELLSNSGLIFIHADWHASHYIQVILDEIFGKKRFVNNIIWYYYNKYSAGKVNLPRAHDTILVYSKSSDYTFNELRLPRKTPKKQLMREMKNGVLKNVKDEDGRVKYRIVTDKKMDDVWKIPCMQPASKEWTGFPTQKHHKLLERIIRLGSNEGDLVADFFCGSGTSLVVAEKLGRRWIGSDISEYSIYITRKRILNLQKKINKFNPFELYTNLNEIKTKIIESGFFQKDISIKRKK
jgi:adenine specific DNA methylase Mod